MSEPRTLAPPERRVAVVSGVERLGAYHLVTVHDAAGPRDPRPGQFYMLAAGFHDLGFRVVATGGTATAIRRMGVPVERIKKLSEGSPNVVERIESGDVDLVINTPTGSGARADGYEIRRAAIGRGIPCITTMSGASAAQRAIRSSRSGETSVISLQELHGGVSLRGALPKVAEAERTT